MSIKERLASIEQRNRPQTKMPLYNNMLLSLLLLLPMIAAINLDFKVKIPEGPSRDKKITCSAYANVFWDASEMPPNTDRYDVNLRVSKDSTLVSNLIQGFPANDKSVGFTNFDPTVASQYADKEDFVIEVVAIDSDGEVIGNSFSPVFNMPVCVMKPGSEEDEAVPLDAEASVAMESTAPTKDNSKLSPEAALSTNSDGDKDDEEEREVMIVIRNRSRDDKDKDSEHESTTSTDDFVSSSDDSDDETSDSSDDSSDDEEEASDDSGDENTSDSSVEPSNDSSEADSSNIGSNNNININSSSSGNSEEFEE